MQIFRRLVAPSSTRQDDIVVKASTWDDMKIVRDQIFVITHRFEDALDPKILHNSLVRLINRDGWRKLGARLRQNKAGRVELHIPREFTPERPAVGYAHRHYNEAIRDHPIGLKMMSSPDLDRPQFHTAMAELLPLSLRPGNPQNFKDYMTSDEPALNLFIVTFTDATLVSLSWPHCAWDMSAHREIMTAWRCVLGGREEDIKPVASFARDALVETAGLAQDVDEGFLLQPYLCKGWNFCLYIMRVIWEGFYGWNKPTPIVLSIPASYMAVLRKEALATRDPDRKYQVPFLSDGDIITAWTTRLCAGALYSQPRRTVTLLSVFDARARLPAVFSAAEVRLQNCVMALHAQFRAAEIRKANNRLGELAEEVRQAIMQQTEPGQVALQGRELLQAIENTGNMAIYGDQSSYSIIMSSWASAGLFEADFSAALVDGATGAGDDSKYETGDGAHRKPRRGRPVGVHGTALNLPPVVTCWHILGKDAAGTYWVIGQPRGVDKDMIQAEFTAVPS